MLQETGLGVSQLRMLPAEAVVAITANGAAVDFDIELVWRNAQGARETRNMAFFAAMQPSPDGWRLAGVRRRLAPGG